MKLIDFSEFEALKELREVMPAPEDGYYELFSPDTHLSGEELHSLQDGFLPVQVNAISRLEDHTLCYKNGRVAALRQGVLHVADCDRVRGINGTTEIQLVWHNEGGQICEDCLQLLRYKGYDRTKARLDQHNQVVLSAFSLEAFFSEYRCHPLRSHLHVRHQIFKKVNISV